MGRKRRENPPVRKGWKTKEDQELFPHSKLVDIAKEFFLKQGYAEGEIIIDRGKFLYPTDGSKTLSWRRLSDKGRSFHTPAGKVFCTTCYLYGQKTPNSYLHRTKTQIQMRIRELRERIEFLEKEIEQARKEVEELEKRKKQLKAEDFIERSYDERSYDGGWRIVDLVGSSPEETIAVECGNAYWIEDLLPYFDLVYHLRVEDGKVIWDKVKGDGA